MSVTLRKRKNADGTTSLRLDIYKDGKKSVETLKHLQLSKPSNMMDRENNKTRLAQAEDIVIQRAAQLQAKDYSMDDEAAKKTVVAVWMQNHVDTYSKKDKRTMQGALTRFTTFLGLEKKTKLTFGELDALLIEDFIEYLEANSTGEGARSYYNRFKKMVKHAYRRKMIKTNVLDFVERKATGNAKKKDILTLDELKQLAATKTESSEVRRAFLFTCVTGLRWCDIKTLEWKHIDLASRKMNLTQSKTQVDLSTPLNDTAITLLGEAGKPAAKIFNLPTANGCNKTLKAWVKRAGISKAITWHNGRHSAGTNLIFNGVDVLTVSKLLGHNSLRHTQRYVDTAAEMKQAATDKINIEL